MVVADVTNEGFIGLDFLTTHQVTLDFATKEVTCLGRDGGPNAVKELIVLVTELCERYHHSCRNTDDSGRENY